MDDTRMAVRIRENLEWSESAGAGAPRGVPRGVAPAEIALDGTDRNRFIAHAYATLLGRSPSPDEVLRQARRLRFLPFLYTRRVFLARLRGCWEAIAHRERERRIYEASVLGRLTEIEHCQEQVRLRLKALQSAVTDLGSEIVSDLRNSPGLAVDRRRAEGSPCAS